VQRFDLMRDDLDFVRRLDPREQRSLAFGGRFLRQRHDAGAACQVAFALVGRQRSGDELQERRLAAAVDPDQCDLLARFHVERDVAQEGFTAVVEIDAAQTQERHGSVIS
jgi:hypothetical protein